MPDRQLKERFRKGLFSRIENAVTLYGHSLNQLMLQHFNKELLAGEYSLKVDG